MPAKKTSSNIRVTLDPDESAALSAALLFFMHRPDTGPIDYSSVVSAYDKLGSGTVSFSRGQIRACIAALRYALQCLSGGPSSYSDVSKFYPSLAHELIPDLIECKPVLDRLLPQLRGKL